MSWGSNCNHHVLGHNDGRPSKAMPKIIDAMRGVHFVDIACGSLHNVAISGQGDVYVWGDNRSNQCGFDIQQHTIESSEILDKDHVRIPTLMPTLFGMKVTNVAQFVP